MGYQNGELGGRNEIGLLEKLPNSYIWVTIISSLALFLRTLFRLAETADGEFYPSFVTSLSLSLSISLPAHRYIYARLYRHENIILRHTYYLDGEKTANKS